MLGPYADVVVINVSSPNTPGLRALQGKEILEKLLKDVVEERNRIAVDGLPKIAVKVACDLNEEELGDVAGAVRSSGVEGVIVSNTTIRRQGLGLKSCKLVPLFLDLELISANQSQVGGLSGRPLFPLSLIALKTLRPLLPPSIPIIGCGGISTGQDALEMAKAGASMIQLYTSFGYRGVGTPRLIKDEITAQLSTTKSSWRNSVGTDYKDGKMGWTDEDRFKKTNEALKKEAEGLGELLKNLSDKEDTASLVRKAEEALRKFKAPQPRDNLLGSTAEGSPASAPASETPESKDSTKTITSGNVGGAPALLESVLPAPAADFAPIVVEENVQPQPQEEVDEWKQTVQKGQRRLV
jgi:dihydroorotate dehydrogenase